MPHKSGKTIIKDKYINILNYVKSKGCKVIHVKYAKRDLGGTYDADSNLICIDRRLKYTIEGCFVLLHEFFHSKQSLLKKYKEFFNLTNKEIYSDRKLHLIIAAEQDASRKAVNLLMRVWRIHYISEDLTKKGLENCIKFWMKFYFKG